MGRRSEQRIAIVFPVIVRGKDSRGAAFAFTTKTADISFSGACLIGLSYIVEPGMKVDLVCFDQEATYRVEWVGRTGSPRAGRVGLRCLEIGKYIWGVPPKEWEPDAYDPSKPEPAPDDSASAHSSPPAWSGKDRRQFARRPCRIETRVFMEDDCVEMSGKITDISLGGCYVEMLQPLPVDTLIKLSVFSGESTLHFSGKVRSSLMGFGMGVSFTGMGPEDFERLRQFAPPTANAPAAAKKQSIAVAPPRSNDSPREGAPPVNARSYAAMDTDSLDLPAPAESLEAIVDLLLRKEIFTRAELVEQLDRLKIVKA